MTEERKSLEAARRKGRDVRRNRRITDFTPVSFDGGKTYFVRSASTGEVVYDDETPAKFDTYADLWNG